jgi:hypothetical protein
MNFSTIQEKRNLQWKIALLSCFLIGMLVGFVINTELHIIEFPKAYGLDMPKLLMVSSHGM